MLRWLITPQAILESALRIIVNRVDVTVGSIFFLLFSVFIYIFYFFINYGVKCSCCHCAMHDEDFLL